MGDFLNGKQVGKHVTLTIKGDIKHKKYIAKLKIFNNFL